MQKKFMTALLGCFVAGFVLVALPACENKTETETETTADTTMPMQAPADTMMMDTADTRPIVNPPAEQ